jgi:hypothetical protein
MTLANLAASDKSIPLTSNETVEELNSEIDVVHSDLFKKRYWPLLVGSLPIPLSSTKDKELPIPKKGEQYQLMRNNIPEDPNVNCDEGIGREEPVLWLPTKNKRRNQFKCLQKWRGVVLEVLQDSFMAKLEDYNEVTPDEVAEILRSEISDEDLPLIQNGSVFYWSIGYHVNSSGQRKRASIIRFRRLPVWTPMELKEAEVRAQKFKSLFGLDKDV